MGGGCEVGLGKGWAVVGTRKALDVAGERRVQAGSGCWPRSTGEASLRGGGRRGLL